MRTVALDAAVVADASIASRYVVGEFLGAGGFAKVFRATQRSTGQQVALKVMHLDHADGPASIAAQLERFRREAQICAALQHPNIVPLVDSGETSDGQPFVVFGLIPGLDLGHVLAAEGALEPAVALHWMTQVADALSCAHANGIVHRDLKPENVMISSAGARRNALVLDFGIGTVAADVTLLPELRRITERGEYLGTPKYSAPEQLRGEPPDKRSDLYSWGLIFVECLTGEAAIGAANPYEAVHLQLSPDPVGLPAALEGHLLHDLLAAATQKDASKRELSAADLVAELGRIDHASLPSRAELLASVKRVSSRPASVRTAVHSGAWLVGAARNPNFTGREPLLRRIADHLDMQSQPVVALHGLGGVGKSQLALEYAYRRAGRYRLCAWIRAEENETLAADFAAIAGAASLSETPNQRRQVEAVRAWLERHDNWLLIFDNAPDPAAIRPYLPRLHTGHVLVTSRHPSWRDLATSVAIDVLEPMEAVDFLLRRTGESELASATELAEELGRLPLALEEAAAYAEATGRTLASYLQLLKTQRRRVLFNEVIGSESRVTLRSTWELSFQAVEREAPRASDVLKLCAFLAPEDVPHALFRRGAKGLVDTLRQGLEDELNLDSSIATLRRYSLIKSESESLSVHRLVQLATRERLGDAQSERWSSHALSMIEAAFPWNAAVGEHHPESGRFLPHAKAALSHAAQHAANADIAARLLRRIGVYLSARGQHEEAQKHLQRAKKLFQTVPNADPVQVGSTLWELGMVLYALGEAENAREHLEDGVRTLEACADKAQLLCAQTFLSLSWVHYTLGDFAASRSSATHALGFLLSKFREEHPLVATALALIARAQWALGALAEAQEYVARATAALERSLDPLHPLNCGTYFIVAQIRYDFGDLDAALQSAVHGRGVGERAYGRDHPLVCLNVLVHGSVLLALGHVEDAAACFERVLESAHRFSHRIQQEFAIARSELARTAWMLGDVAGARRKLEHALGELPRICGHKGRVAGQAHAALAMLLNDTGEPEAARHHARAAIDALAADYGAEHSLCRAAERQLQALF